MNLCYLKTYNAQADRTGYNIWIASGPGQTPKMTFIIQEELDIIRPAMELIGVQFINVTEAASPTTPVPTVPGVTAGTVVTNMTLHDTIELRAKTENARGILASHGTWWKITAAWAANQKTGRPDCWILRSLRKREGGITDKMVELHIYKQRDPQYDVVRVCASPKVFNRKDYS